MDVKRQEGGQDYDQIALSAGHLALSCLLGIMGAGLVVFIFYRNAWMPLVGMVAGGIIGPQMEKKRLVQKRKERLRDEFKEALYSLMVALRAGRSLEGAFYAALEDLDEGLMPHIYTEWQTITKQLSLGISVEESLLDFAARSHIEEIESFARTIEICKRTEGDMVRVMENTIQLLQERMEIQGELQVLLAKKKTEQRILNLMPFLVIGLLLLMAPEYLQPLYRSLQGQIIMTVCALLTVISVLLSRKIAKIAL